MKKTYDPKRPRGPLAVAAVVLSAFALSIFVMLPLAVASQVPELDAWTAPAAEACKP